MLPEFGTNGHHPEFTQQTENSIPQLISLMQSTASRLQERKLDSVQVHVVDIKTLGAHLDLMEARHVTPSVSDPSFVKKNGQIIPLFDEAPSNSFQYLGMIIHDRMQQRIDFTAAPSELATLPAELQDFFPEMGTVFFRPMNIALVRSYSMESSPEFGIVMSPPKLEGDKVGIMLSTDRRCEPSVIGNGVSQLRRLHLTQRLMTMRSGDPIDQGYTRLMTSAGFWVVRVLNERMDYC